MSGAFALIKFKKTSNIYYGYYEGSSSILRPHICTPEECYDEQYDWYDPKSYIKTLDETKTWEFPDYAPDIDDVEIYSDYGYGFYWRAKGSEIYRMVDHSSCYDEDGYLFVEEKRGQPKWAKKFLEKLEES